jgi:hypothetical protein
MLHLLIWSKPRTSSVAMCTAETTLPTRSSEAKTSLCSSQVVSVNAYQSSDSGTTAFNLFFTLTMFSKTHFPVSHCCCTLSVLIQYASMMTNYLPPSSYAINNPHVSMAVFVPLCQLLHIQLEPKTPVSTH